MELMGVEVASFDANYLSVSAAEEPGEQETSRAAVDVSLVELTAFTWGVGVLSRHVWVVWGNDFQRGLDGVHYLPSREWYFSARRDRDYRSVPSASWPRGADGVGFPGRLHSVRNEELLGFEGVEEFNLDVYGGVGRDSSRAFSEEV